MMYFKELMVLIAVICIAQTTGKSVSAPRRGRGVPQRGSVGAACRDNFNGQCMPWRNHTKCPQIRQRAGASGGCAENEFCCAGPLRPLVESPRSYQWYDVCGTQSIQTAQASSSNKSKMAASLPLAHSTFIVGGDPASQGQFPWQASILADGDHVCGGTLIDDQFILTAAHCLGEPASGYDVVLGSLHALGGDQHAVQLPVSSVNIHPGYHGTHEDDIALIKLSRSVAAEISSHHSIMPACSPQTQIDYTARHGLVAGWGKTGYPIGPDSDVLLYAEVPIIDRSTCCQYHCDASCYSATCTVYEYNICAGHDAGGVGTCIGDSGGPLVVSLNTESPRYHLLGIVSWADGCAQERSPTVYIDVRHFMPWIDEITQEYG